MSYCCGLPQKKPVNGEWWDGKVGTYFVVEKVAAAHSSKSHPAGTLEAKMVKVAKEVTVDMILTNLLPAIEDKKWPQFARKLVRIQQDNATPHPRPGSDERIDVPLADMTIHGWGIKYVTQPPNSLDCNTLDLVFWGQSYSFSTSCHQQLLTAL